MPGAPLSLLEREEISLALTEDHLSPWAVIGRRVGRHPTTVADTRAARTGRNLESFRRLRSLSAHDY